MKLSAKIWKELGPLAQYVERVDHELGTCKCKPGTAQQDVDAVNAVVAAHDPLAQDPEEVAAEAKCAALRQLTLDANADALMTQLANATLADIWRHVNDTFPALTVPQRKTIAIALAGAAMIFRERA